MAVLRDKSAFWAHVTIFGTLWGGLELTLGTFLHVLHIPKAGLVMTTLSVILMIALRTLYPQRGATLGAAIIASSIKCLSPGGFILGPVFGILSEALMLEIGLLLSSSSPLTAMLAGILAIFSCQFQSLFKTWLYYVADFSQAILKLAEKFFSIESSATIAMILIGGFFSIFAAVGAIAGIFGWFCGKRVLHQLEVEKTVSHPILKPDNDDIAYADTLTPDTTTHAQEAYRPKSKRDPEETAKIVKTRAIVLPFALCTIALQFVEYGAFKGMFPVLTSLVLWLLALSIFARPVIKAIWWPKFWLLTAIISLIAGCILGFDFNADDLAQAFKPLLALHATLSMMSRGAFVFSLITWLTRCIRTEEFFSFCNWIRVPELGYSLTQAYEILPQWLDKFNRMIKLRPPGFFGTLRYLEKSAMDVLIQASHEAENRCFTHQKTLKKKTQSSPSPPDSSPES